MIIYVANKQMNSFMKQFDLKPDYKWFIKAYETRVKNPFTKKKIMNMINSSFEKKQEFVIPAISYDGVLYSRKGVLVLSDGKKEMTIVEK